MPGVLVDSVSSSPHAFFPFESAILSGSCFDGNAGFDPGSLHCDVTPVSPHSPHSLSHFAPADVSCSSPTDRVREFAQRFLPKSNLGFPTSGNGTDPSFDYSSELAGMPIPSPRKGFYSGSSADSMVGSPLFSESNGMGSPVFSDAFSALHKFLPSNTNDDEIWPVDSLPAMDAYSCDDFRMYEFKVRRCMRGRSHDWTECPFAHPGEKARRRDPRRIHYSGTACPDFRKGSCKRGDSCEFAHGVFECWLHPARYRTQPCKDGRACRRRVCFFAHTVEQLRVLPSVAAAAPPSGGAGSPRKAMSNYDGSPLRQALPGALFTEGMNEMKDDRGLGAPRLLQKVIENKGLGCGGHGLALSPTSTMYGSHVSSSPTSTLHGYHVGSPPAQSPPLSPSTSPPMSPEPYVCWPRNVSSTHSHPQSPLSNASVPAHRRHLNRLQTMPTISIPSVSSDLVSDSTAFDDFPFSLPPASMYSPHGAGVSELLHSIQALQLRTRVADLQKASSMPSTPQHHKFVQHNIPLRQCLYRSIPGTPNSDTMWDMLLEPAAEMQPPLRVESGRDLRAKIYGRIGKENGVESNEDPDLGWVNELVK